MSTQNPNPGHGDPIALPIAEVHTEQLREVLAAAAGPASPSELHGEAAALAAFRAARPAPAPTDTRRTSAMKPKFAAMFTAKAAAVALVATSMGGVAFAASTGNVPNPLPGSGKSADERAADAADRQAEKDADAAARAVDKAAGEADRATDKAARDAAKAAEANGFDGLCNAFLHHSADGKGKWADSAAFTRLRTAGATAAGVEFADFDAVDLTGYCNDLLAATPAAEGAEAAEGDDQSQAGDDHGQAGDDHGQAGDDHGKSGDKGQAGDDHGKAATAPNNAKGKAAAAAAGDNGKAGDDHSTAGDDNSQAGDDHGTAGDAGQGAEYGEAGDDHGTAGEAHPAAAAH